MNQKAKWPRAAKAALLLAAVALFAFNRSGPGYNGKLLCAWFADFRSLDPAVRSNAVVAFRALGPEAIEYLTNALAADPKFDKVRASIRGGLPFAVERAPRVAEILRTSWEAQLTATIALMELGPSASNAVPALLNAHSEIPDQCSLALLSIGPASIPPLIGALGSGRSSERIFAIATLGKFGRLASNALPQLAQIRATADDFERKTAERALEEIGAVPISARTNSFERS